MKILKYLSVFILLTLLTNCSEQLLDNNESDNTSSNFNYSNLEISKTIVFDSNDNKLGYVVSIDEDSITLFNDNDYLFTIYWNGEFEKPNKGFKFSEIDGGGSIYIQVTIDLIYYGKTVYYFPYDSKLYTYKNFDFYGNTYPISTTTPYNSYYESGTNSIINNSGSYYLNELKEVTKSEMGFPDTISLPLKIIYYND